MAWFYVNPDTIAHGTGISIELRQGTWSCPMGFTPHGHNALSGLECAALIREGLEFARTNSYSEYRLVSGARIDKFLSFGIPALAEA